MWTSPYPRALETAELAAREMGIAKRVKPRVELEAGMEPEVAATLLGEEAGDSVMIVGHNPDLERLAAWLIDANGGAAIELKKGSVACVESEAPPGPGTGELRWLLTPRQLEIIGD